VLLLAPAPARACDDHPSKAKATVEVKDPDAKKQPELLAEKCSCEGAGDCTCKKGQCKCSKCGNRRYKVSDSLRERTEYRELKARRNAAAGVFI